MVIKTTNGLQLDMFYLFFWRILPFKFILEDYTREILSENELCIHMTNIYSSLSDIFFNFESSVHTRRLIT